MLLLLQAWLVLTVGLLAVLGVVVSVQALARSARRRPVVAPAAALRPALRLVRT